ncbi:MAG: hypothetical protein ACJAYN_002027 [Bermanella sp.]|jgi:hypothetical protein
MQTQSYMKAQYVSSRTLGSLLITKSSMVSSNLIEPNNQNDLLGVSFTHHSAFQLQKSNIRKSRWIAHVSCKTKLAASHKLVLNIKPTQTASAFDILERLLFSKTCAVIYSDERLPLHQVQMLKQMAIFSGTEVIFIADKVEFNLLQLDDLEKA